MAVRGRRLMLCAAVAGLTGMLVGCGTAPVQVTRSETVNMALGANTAVRVNNEIGAVDCQVDDTATEAVIEITRIASAESAEAADTLLPEILVGLTGPAATEDALHIDVPRPAAATGVVSDWQVSSKDGTFSFTATTKSIRIAEVRLKITVPPGHPVYSAQGGDTVDLAAWQHAQQYISLAGDVILSESTSGAIKATALAGDVVIMNHHGSVMATSLAGNITLHIAELATTDQVLCQTSAGSIDLTLPAGVQANVNAACLAGAVDVDAKDFTAVGTAKSQGAEMEIALNGGGATIRLRTMAGSIRVHGQ